MVLNVSARVNYPHVVLIVISVASPAKGERTPVKYVIQPVDALTSGSWGCLMGWMFFIPCCLYTKV
jgi:hypothetical protein